jgi:hypothetical protein
MIQEATGEWLHFLDDDNVIYKTFMQELNNELNTKHDLIIIKILHSYFGMKPFPRKNSWERVASLGYNAIDALNLVVRAAVAKTVGWKDTGPSGADGHFAANVAKAVGKDKVKYIDKVLAEHRNVFGKKGRGK